MHCTLFSCFSLLHWEALQNPTIILRSYSTTRSVGTSIMTIREARFHGNRRHGGHRFFKRSVSLLQEQDLRRRCENVQSNLGYSYGEGNRDRMKAAIFKRKRRRSEERRVGKEC